MSGTNHRTVSDQSESRRARGLDRAFHILDYLRAQKRPLRPNEIAQGIDAPKSSVYEVINLLIEHKALEYADREGRVFLGRKLYFLGRDYLRHFDLARESEDYLAELVATTQETAQLCMVDGDKYTVVLMKEGARPFRISTDVGEPVPIPWTASGRLLLAHLDDAEILSLIPQDDFVLPSGERLDQAQFLAEIRQADAAGFFSFDSVTDTYTHCLAAPVYDEASHCVATLCLVAPRTDAAKNLQLYRSALIDCAAGLTAKLTGEGPAIRDGAATG